MKRFLCFILILSLLIFTSIHPDNDAKAFFPLVIAGVALSAEAVAAIGTILCAGGIYAVNHESINNAVATWYDISSTRTKQKIINTINTIDIAHDAIMYIAPEVWESMIDFRDNYIFAKAGTNTFNTDYADYNVNGVTVPVTTSEYDEMPIMIPQGFDMWGTKITWEIIPVDATRDIVKFYRNGIYEWDNYYKKDELYFTCHIDNINHYFNLIAHNNLQTASHKYLVYSSYIDNDNITKKTFDYTGDTNIIGNSNYDILKDGTRKVYVPSSIDALLGKTASDVTTAPVVNPPAVTPYSDSWTGKFSDCATGDYTFVGTGTITGTMGVTTAGEWVGEWGETVAGEREWVGVYTGADGLTWTGTATEDLVADPPAEGTEFKYPEMKIPADIIKNKFPFSIPWDLTTAIKSFVATPEAPRWVINFPSNIFVGGGQIVIDFTQFETWAKVVRFGVFAIFNIFLILATRRIIGAS